MCAGVTAARMLFCHCLISEMPFSLQKD